MKSKNDKITVRFPENRLWVLQGLQDLADETGIARNKYIIETLTKEVVFKEKRKGNRTHLVQGGVIIGGIK